MFYFEKTMEILRDCYCPIRHMPVFLHAKRSAISSLLMKTQRQMRNVTGFPPSFSDSLSDLPTSLLKIHAFPYEFVFIF